MTLFCFLFFVVYNETLYAMPSCKLFFVFRLTDYFIVEVIFICFKNNRAPQYAYFAMCGRFLKFSNTHCKSQVQMLKSTRNISLFCILLFLGCVCLLFIFAYFPDRVLYCFRSFTSPARVSVALSFT